jgi:hypothetical protein
MSASDSDGVQEAPTGSPGFVRGFKPIVIPKGDPGFRAPAGTPEHEAYRVRAGLNRDSRALLDQRNRLEAKLSMGNIYTLGQLWHRLVPADRERLANATPEQAREWLKDPSKPVPGTPPPQNKFWGARAIPPVVPYGY